MRNHEIRELPEDELKAKIVDTRREIVSMRFQLAARKLENPAGLRKARKLLSRLLTLQSEAATGKVRTPKKQVEPNKEAKAKAKAEAV